MDSQTIKNVWVSILVLACFLLLAQHIEGAQPQRNERNTQITSRGRASSAAQWKAHPEKGWVRADESHDQRDGNKENSKRANEKLGGNRANKQK
jgi:hypothetical protein